MIAVLALSMLPVSFARAEIAVMESGKILYVDRTTGPMSSSPWSSRAGAR